VIDVYKGHAKNAFDSMHINSEAISNETDDSDSQDAKHDKQKA
jgi:hypothetical protein